jgi:hypothetical protein
MNPEDKKRIEEDAHKWRLQIAEELLKLFEEHTGHPATSIDELTGWRTSQRGQAIIKLRAKKS